MTTIAMTTSEFVALATAWITAIFTVLGILASAAGAFWLKYGDKVTAFIHGIRQMKAQQDANAENIQRINNAPGTPAVELVAPAATPPPVSVVPATQKPDEKTEEPPK